jgi:hypothetical protein
MRVREGLDEFGYGGFFDSGFPSSPSSYKLLTFVNDHAVASNREPVHRTGAETSGTLKRDYHVVPGAVIRRNPTEAGGKQQST